MVHYVDLPRQEKKILSPFNYPVALKILEKTNNHFESKNIIKGEGRNN